MTKPRGLGRGLDALLGGAPEVNTMASHPDEVRDFPTSSGKERCECGPIRPHSDIEANPNQPRREFDVDGLKELADEH